MPTTDAQGGRAGFELWQWAVLVVSVGVAGYAIGVATLLSLIAGNADRADWTRTLTDEEPVMWSAFVVLPAVLGLVSARGARRCGSPFALAVVVGVAAVAGCLGLLHRLGTV